LVGDLVDSLFGDLFGLLLGIFTRRSDVWFGGILLHSVVGSDRFVWARCQVSPVPPSLPRVGGRGEGGA